jgi:hypothetical protein
MRAQASRPRGTPREILAEVLEETVMEYKGE